MLNVGRIESEVVVEGEGVGSEPEAERPVESRKEELRELVRELVREELDRLLRTEARG